MNIKLCLMGWAVIKCYHIIFYHDFNVYITGYGFVQNIVRYIYMYPTMQTIESKHLDNNKSQILKITRQSKQKALLWIGNRSKNIMSIICDCKKDRSFSKCGDKLHYK